MQTNVSVLFNEPKLLKFNRNSVQFLALRGFSALQRAEIAEMRTVTPNAPIEDKVSVLFNEPKLLKLCHWVRREESHMGFSALQRAEIAEIECVELL